MEFTDLPEDVQRRAIRTASKLAKANVQDARFTVFGMQQYQFDFRQLAKVNKYQLRVISFGPWTVHTPV